MNIEFEDDDLERILHEARFSGGFPWDVVKAFRKRMQYIEAAEDERDFYEMRSLHYKKLKGKRKEEYSMRLNDQYRLILRTKVEGTRRTIVVLSIKDYH